MCVRAAFRSHSLGCPVPISFAVECHRVPAACSGCAVTHLHGCHCRGAPSLDLVLLVIYCLPQAPLLSSVSDPSLRSERSYRPQTPLHHSLFSCMPCLLELKSTLHRLRHLQLPFAWGKCCPMWLPYSSHAAFRSPTPTRCHAAHMRKPWERPYSTHATPMGASMQHPCPCSTHAALMSPPCRSHADPIQHFCSAHVPLVCHTCCSRAHRHLYGFHAAPMRAFSPYPSTFLPYAGLLCSCPQHPGY